MDQVLLSMAGLYYWLICIKTGISVLFFKKKEISSPDTGEERYQGIRLEPPSPSSLSPWAASVNCSALLAWCFQSVWTKV